MGRTEFPRTSTLAPNLSCGSLTILSVIVLQGHLFRAAFLKQVPLFMRNLTENIALCLVASGIEATSRYCLALAEQQWQRSLTERIHEDYFKNMVRR